MVDIELVGHEYHYEIENIIKPYTGYIKDASIRSILKGNLCRAEIYEGDNLVSFKEELGNEDQKYTKQLLIRTLYQVLCEFTGVKMPWGFLTGIRPTKIVHEMFENNIPKERIKKQLLEFYDIREDKVELMIKVAEKERGILEKNKADEISIYIGIPFCPTRCLYCSFTSYAIDHREQQVEAYLEALEKEIAFGGKYSSSKTIRSIYIGGGTPTSLNEEQLERLLMLVNQHFNVKDAEEFTVEAGRPDTITKRKLELLKQYHVGRISINPQTMNEETLLRIGRKHTTEDIVKVFSWAREIGHSNINMDLIIGLPGESPRDVKNTMDKIKALEPDSITVHTMAIKRASRLRESLEEYTLTQADEIEEMISITSQGAYEMGMEPYYLYRQKNMLGNFENVGYCKPGKESVYNIEIMEEKETILALGAGAITKVVDPKTNKIERIPNVKNVEEYINRIDEMLLRKQKGLKDLDNDF